MAKKSFLALGALLAVPGLMAAIEWNEMPLADGTYFAGEGTLRSEVYEIPVPAQSGLEFMLALEEGQVMVYEWSAEGVEEGKLTAEFHGHTEPADDQGTVMFYKVHTDGRGSGALAAPFSGVHGWYLNNQGDTGLVVTLEATGFFEEVE